MHLAAAARTLADASDRWEIVDWPATCPAFFRCYVAVTIALLVEGAAMNPRGAEGGYHALRRCMLQAPRERLRTAILLFIDVEELSTAVRRMLVMVAAVSRSDSPRRSRASLTRGHPGEMRERPQGPQIVSAFIRAIMGALACIAMHDVLTD
jgi:hypothetical protein